MSRSRSKVKPKTRHSAEVVPVEIVEALRDLKLAQRGLAGDVEAMIEWLSLFGGAEWRLPEDMQPPGRYRHLAGPTRRPVNRS